MMNWYKQAQLIDGKEPWQITQSDFLNYHYTGSIQSSAYDQYKTIEGLEWLKKEEYPILYNTKDFNGITVEFRKSGEKLKYTQKDPKDPKGFEFLRNKDGELIFMTEEQMREEGLPTEDQTLVAFVGDKAIGWAANEWGATGVWVVEEYQKIGIGSYLIKEFRKSMKKENKIGQMTPAGVQMTKAYHRNLVQEALNEGKSVPEEVIEDYPKLVGKKEDAGFWAKQVEKNPIRYYELTQEFKNAPEVRRKMIERYVSIIKQDPHHVPYIPDEFKNVPEIQEAQRERDRRKNNELV